MLEIFLLKSSTLDERIRRPPENNVVNILLKYMSVLLI